MFKKLVLVLSLVWLPLQSTGYAASSLRELGEMGVPVIRRMMSTVKPFSAAVVSPLQMAEYHAVPFESHRIFGVLSDLPREKIFGSLKFFGALERSHFSSASAAPIKRLKIDDTWEEIARVTGENCKTTVSRIEDGGIGEALGARAQSLHELAGKFINSPPKSLKYSRTLKDEVQNMIYLWQKGVEQYLRGKFSSEAERSSFDDSLSSIDYDTASNTAWHDVIECYLRKYTPLEEDQIIAILNISCIQTKAGRELRG